MEYIENHKKGHVKDDDPYVLREEEEAFKISDESMFEISECKEFRRLGFVDGGTGILLRSSDFSISFNRVAGVLFEENNLKPLNTSPDVIEFYTATIIEPTEEGKLAFKSRLFPLEPEYAEFLPGEEIPIPIDEARLRGGFLPNIEYFGGVMMRYAEWSYGEKFIENELSEGDIYVRDGSLQTSYKNEINLSNGLFSRGYHDKVVITGLSKSCRIITENGDSLITMINLIGNRKFPKSRWYYHPIYEITKADNQADIYFVKLHELSEYPFRFDIYLDQSKELEDKEKEIIISNIAENSNELSFPGYPFGLIKVDQMARIGHAEIEPLKVQILSEFDSEHYNKYIKPRLRSVDAHDLLNILRK